MKTTGDIFVGAMSDRMSRLGLLHEPVGYVDTPNLYEFVRDDPIVLTDPAGLKPNWVPSELNTAMVYLKQQVNDWRACGYGLAANMLDHFLGNTGSPYALTDSDIKEIRNNHNFNTALMGDISARFPSAVNGSGASVKVKGKFTFYFKFDPFDNNGLFYAFGSVDVSYEGTVSSSRVKVSRGYAITKCDNLSITVFKKSYNFSTSTHGSIDYIVPAFNCGWMLETANWAKPFSAKGTFKIPGD